MSQKQNWADIEDEEEHSKSPQVNTYDQQQMTVEYKLQPTGETVVHPTKHHEHNNRYNRQKPIKKPLLSAEEMIEQINNENHYNVYIHCFAVNGDAAKFREVFESKVTFNNIIENNNSDRDASIDLKFKDKEEAIKFIKLSQTTSINGKNFRIKFGRNLKSDNFKNDHKGEYKPRGNHERREHNNERYSHRHENQETREYKPRGEHKGEYKPRGEHKGEYKPRGEYKGEYKPHHKREFNQDRKQEEKPVEKKEDTTQEQQPAAEQVPSTPFRPMGFTNTKRDAHRANQEGTLTNTANEQIHCVDTNAKVIERQKREEQERLAKQEEHKDEAEVEEKKENTHHHQNKDNHHHHHQHQHHNNDNKHHGKGKREDGSNKRNTSAKGKSHQGHAEEKPAKTEKVVYEKKEAATTKPAEQKQEQPKQEAKQAADRNVSEGKKKLKLPAENKAPEDEWTVAGSKKTEKKPRNNNDERRGRGGNNNNNNNNNDSKKSTNNNAKKPQVTYERKEAEKK